MNAPQIVMIGFIVAEIAYAIAKHGEPKTDRYDAVTTFISWGCIAAILYWGDFFRVTP